MSEISNPAKFRDPDRDRLRAVEDLIALHRSVGKQPTPYLLQQKAEWEAKLGISPEARPVEAAFERKDLASAPEVAVPRGPGRPRKIDVAPAAGS